MFKSSEDIHSMKCKNCVKAWEQLTGDAWILQAVKGYKIPFTRPPYQRLPPPLPTIQGKSEALDTEIQKLLLKKAIEPVPQEKSNVEFLSTIFVVPKKDGGHRPVFNLKSLNNFINPPHFKMEGFHTLKEILKKGDFMGKLDLKDAYTSVPIALKDRAFLRFLWKGQKFQFSTLPFGLSTAPFVFTKLLKPVAGHLRSQGIRLVIYLDDFLFLNQCPERLQKEMLMAKSLLENLGFCINQTKSVFSPNRTIEFLGVSVDSTNLQISLPQNKLKGIKKDCQSLLLGKHVRARKLAHTVGKMVAAKEAIRFSMVHVRYLQRVLNIAVRQPMGYESVAYITKEAQQELNWWVEESQSQNGCPIQAVTPDLVIQTDASKLGWGAIWGMQKTGGLWSLKEKTWHINVLELLAVFLALKSFTKEMYNQHILIQSDNVSTLSYINKQGGTKSRDLQFVAKQIWDYCQNHQLMLTGEHIPGKLNVEADHLSGHWEDASYWMLEKETFLKIQKVHGLFHIDLFANCLNFQCPNYCSWKPDPGAIWVNAFTKSWKDLQCPYAFPPFALVARCLRKILEEKATVCIVTPKWQAQPWYAQALEMSICHPLLIPPSLNLLLSSQGEQHPLVIERSLYLIVWKVSGKDSLPEAYRKGLLPWLPPLGGKAPVCSTIVLGSSFQAGVVEGKLIPFVPL